MKKAAWIKPAVTAVSELVERERQMLRGIAAADSSNTIADRLDLRHGTMRVYLHHLYQRIGVKNRAQAARWWSEQNATTATEHPDTELLNFIADQAALLATGKLTDSAPSLAAEGARAAGARFNDLVTRMHVHPRDALRTALNEIRAARAK